MAHKARAASFPTVDCGTPSPPASPAGTTPTATFPPLPPPHCRWPFSHSTTAALPPSPPPPRRVRHLRRHFCRWCKLFHVDASSRWRPPRPRTDGRGKAMPAPSPLSPLCTFPFSHATASRRADGRSGGTAGRAGSAEVQGGRALSAAAAVAVSLRLLEKRKRYRSSCPIPLQLFAFPPFVRTERAAA